MILKTISLLLIIPLDLVSASLRFCEQNVCNHCKLRSEYKQYPIVKEWCRTGEDRWRIISHDHVIEHSISRLEWAMCRMPTSGFLPFCTLRIQSPCIGEQICRYPLRTNFHWLSKKIVVSSEMNNVAVVVLWYDLCQL